MSLSPHYMEAWCNQAVIHRQRGNLKDALAAYERAAMGAPNHPCVLEGLAGCCAHKASLLNSQGRRAEAVKLFDAALMRDPTNAGGQLGTALAILLANVPPACHPNAWAGPCTYHAELSAQYKMDWPVQPAVGVCCDVVGRGPWACPPT